MRQTPARAIKEYTAVSRQAIYAIRASDMPVLAQLAYFVAVEQFDELIVLYTAAHMQDIEDGIPADTFGERTTALMTQCDNYHRFLKRMIALVNRA